MALAIRIFNSGLAASVQRAQSSRTPFRLAGAHCHLPSSPPTSLATRSSSSTFLFIATLCSFILYGAVLPNELPELDLFTGRNCSLGQGQVLQERVRIALCMPILLMICLSYLGEVALGVEKYGLAFKVFHPNLTIHCSDGSTSPTMRTLLLLTMTQRTRLDLACIS
jgi:hypothetical protein